MPRSILDMLYDLYKTVKPSDREFGGNVKDFIFGMDLDTAEGLEALKQKMIKQNQELLEQVEKKKKIITEIEAKIKSARSRKDPFEGYDPNHPYDDWDYWERVYNQSRSGYRSSDGNRHSYGREDPTIKEHYKTLGLRYGENLETVRMAWRKLVEQYHPDKFSGQPKKYQNALELTKMVNEAYQAISRWLQTQP